MNISMKTPLSRSLMAVCAALALMGAGCGPAKPPEPAADLQVPSPEATGTAQTSATATTTPTAPDATWQTSASTDGSFRFRHPKPGDMPVPLALDTDLAMDLGPTISNGVATDVPRLSLIVREVRPTDKGLNGCYYSEMGWAAEQKPAERKTSFGGHEFCITDTADAGAGNRWFTRSYATALGKNTLIFQFTVHSVECSLYEDPKACIYFDQARDTVLMEAIMQTVGF